MRVRTHFPLEENLTRAKGSEPVVEVSVEGSKAEARVLFNDLNRLLSLIDEVCPGLQDEARPAELEQASYDRVSSFVEALDKELNP